MTLAHAGLAIAIAGMTGAGLWKVEKVEIMRPGGSLEIAGYALTLEDVIKVAGPNYDANRARLTVRRDDRVIAVQQPEKRLYRVQNMPTTEAAIRTNWMADLYTVLGDADGQGGWTVRVYHNPLVPWIWTGTLVMVLGGLVSLSDRRLRIGAPIRRAARTPGAPAKSVTSDGTA